MYSLCVRLKDQRSKSIYGESVVVFISNRFSPPKLYFDYFQVMDMSDKEVEQLARHLGHDPKTHKEFYRLAHSTIELSKVIVAYMRCGLQNGGICRDSKCREKAICFSKCHFLCNFDFHHF